MEKKIKKILLLPYTYYADIFVFYFFTFFLLTKQIEKITYPDRVYSLLIANSLLLASTYLLNKLSDKKEDTTNGTSALQTNTPTVLLLLTLYSISLFLYASQHQPIFILYWFILFILGILYSFPRRYKLKKIFLLKNILPSFSWYLSLCVMFFAGFDNPPTVTILYLLLPYFLLFFIFEILWDMPDEKGDAEHGIQTLPVVIGFEKTRIVLLLLNIPILFLHEHLRLKIISLCIILFTLNLTKNMKKIHYQFFLSCLLLVIFVLYLYFK